MQKPFYKPFAVLLSLFGLAFLTVGVTLALHMTSPVEPPQPNTIDTTDLRVESFTLSPAAPLAPRQPMTLTAVLRNSGTTSVTGRRVYFYLNPTQRPPISTTTPLKEFVAALTWPAGDAQTIEYGNFTVNATGCDNVAYVWVDPLERIDESDEANNLAEIRFCVEHPDGAGNGPDRYEEDNVCEAAAEIATDGVAQVRNFATSTDVDWVKFQATQGVTYTLTAAGTGQDAYPNLEIWRSCAIPPPGSFGTTARIEFRAPETTTYYMRLDNDQAIGNPATTTYELTVDAVGESGEPGAPPPSGAPLLTGISPNQGVNDIDTHVTITGAGFQSPTMVELCTMQNGQCATEACEQILDVSFIPEQNKIFSVVPAYTFAPGAYCLAVTNEGGETGYLENAFSVQPGRPLLYGLTPVQSYAELPTNLVIYGQNFFDGLRLHLSKDGSGEEIALASVVVDSRTQARATVPAALTPGIYSLLAAYDATESIRLPAAFTVLPPDEDLFSQTQELWLEPVAPRVGEPARLGLIVHRRGGVQTDGVDVRFAVDGTVIGNAIAPLLAPNSQASTEALIWTPAQAGDFVLSATIDPNQRIAEASEENNVITQTVRVLAAAPDVDAPRVDSLTLHTNQTTVTTPQIYLNADATDYPVSNPSGVASLRFLEYEYNAGNRLWIPVQDSQWVSFPQAQRNYRWTLSPVGGNHYIQAWAKDNAGNISVFPYQLSIDYLPPTDRVTVNQTRLYRRTLAVGDKLAVVVQPTAGDPDLYIWPPDWGQGRPPWVSNRSGTERDVVTIANAPVSGVYQIEVYGYSTADYTIDIQVNPELHLRNAGDVSAVNADKPTPTAPLVDPNSAPLQHGAATPTPTPMPTSAPVSTATPVSTTTPVSTATVTPVLTSTPTSTPVPTQNQIYLPAVQSNR